MTHYACLNTLGLRLDEGKLRQIPTPRFELFSHITLKTVQAGAVIGGVLAAPITTGIKGECGNCEASCDRAYRFGTQGMKIGAIAGPVLFSIWAMQTKPSTDGYTDRCYRLRHNKNQLFSDRLCFLGLAAGAGVAKYMGEDLCKGMFFGFTGGLVGAGLINTMAGFM
ncbi:hypothetical protein CAPTEDRAFT_21433 [Capitella teleta]|uniref:Uncharacterized protein n=1 Tax=Capitella teleta TaxID=283909 RepID=R7TB91_CAPTE|nr:hypothetical protein CAPTEDRAFT_21433 [Capitella teleta]|eukprot:ELT88732.1 hypothetical protein CAPTEDRAFT_21433 [Capitella teleta]